MRRTQVQLTEEQFRRLREAAAHRSVSIAEVIREAVDRHLTFETRPGARRQRAVSAIGGFHSGLHDVSEEHDRDLTEAYDT